MPHGDPDRILNALIHHVTLPPRLPFRDDLNGGAVDRALAQRLANYARAFRYSLGTEHYKSWSLICGALDQYVRLHGSGSGHLDKDALKDAFVELSNSTSDDGVLILHIATQNTGLIIRKDKVDGYIFESLEASPRAAAVLASKSALQWDFPSRAVAISRQTFEDPGFQEHTAKFLEQASIENVKDFAATTLKAGSYAFESRDTANPALIGQLLMVLLEANGQAHTITITRKRVRDDVCWDDGAANPWRRSPTWLLLRVSLQRFLCLLQGGQNGTLHYKVFVAYFVARLSEELSEAEPLPAEHLAHARAKLARRLAKIQTKKMKVPLELSESIDDMMSRLDNGFAKTLQLANDRLNAEWTKIRRWSQKQIPRLPIRVEETNLVLSLANSRERLQQLCRTPLPNKQPTRNSNHGTYLTTYVTTMVGTEGQDFDVSHYVGLAEFEYEVELQSAGIYRLPSQPATDERCLQLANEIQRYQQAALPAYYSNPEQLSVMILTIMELWVSLDLVASQMFPLLLEYETGISTEILHVLQLSRLADLRRLQAVENHLRSRHESANHALPSVFSDPSRSCFAVRYFEQDTTMRGLFDKITSDGDRARERKREEWETKSAEYNNLLKKAAEKTCLYVTEVDRFGESYHVHNDNGCEKHYLERAAKRIRIDAYEYPLPENQDVAKAAVFELLCPRGFAAWRDTNWNILSNLGRESQLVDAGSPLLIRNYSGLRSYGTCEPHAITLASTTKSILSTHWKIVPFPTPLEMVCFSNHLRLGLYDQKQKSWIGRQNIKVSFAHHCSSSLPTRSSFSLLGFILRAASDNTGRSANEIIGSQTERSIALTPFEYIGFQELLLGTKLKWIQLLRELASTNINFGIPATVTLISQVALQVGCPWEDKILRASHWVFTDDQFCQAFIEQIRQRLEAIKTNWREASSLESLITLTQRLWELGESTDVTEQAANIFRDIRATALGWTRSLRQEILTAKDGKTAQMRSRDAMLAALLFRRTYVLEAQDLSDYFATEALAYFIECSIILYDNMPEDGPGRLSKLPLPVRNMFIRDLKIVHRLKSKLHKSILSTGIAIDCAMNKIWPEVAEAPPRAFTQWKFCLYPYEQWVTAHSVATDTTRSQEFHYNIIEGSLLVDYQKLGRLPEEYIKHGFFQQFLGERLHFTRPSPIPGMSYVLAASVDGHLVHFGFRDGEPFLRAVRGFDMLEAIPPRVFLGSVNAEDADLPMPLIADHCHWLNLDSGTLSIRPQTSMWHPKPSDWTLDITTGHARRRNSRLVDPRSSIFMRIAKIFEPFEHRSRILVFQPQKRSLSVELRNLKLDFAINYQGLLESRQLRAIVDDNQDAGTLYGLESKLVLRDRINPRDRSVIVAMGPISIQRHNGHVCAHSNKSMFYCRFSINTILQRLDCPPEPRVVYMKAYCHAITSFVVPDPLTGRTGTEEALHSLASGIAQPWAPVDSEAYLWLQLIASLSPRRSYYPTDLKVQQRVIWLDSLPFATQDDRFYPAAARIIDQCRRLYRFSTDAGKPPDEVPGSDDHLLQRASARNANYRFHSSSLNMEKFSDMVYLARDRISSARRRDAFQAATLIRRWSRKIHVTTDLADILQHWPLIQGYQDVEHFEPYLLDELLSLDPASRWGSLFNYCQELSRKRNSYGAMFFFAIIAFGGRVDMTLVRTLIAFTVMREFQSLSVPKWASYTNFQKKITPTVRYLVQVMDPAVIPYPKDERSLLGEIALNYKQYRALEAAQKKYEQSAEEVRGALAEEMLRQWPCETPSVVTSEDCDCVDLERAVLLVQSEWIDFFKNHELWAHLLNVQQILDSCESASVIHGPQDDKTDTRMYPIFTTTGAIPTMQDLMETAELLHISRSGVPNLSPEAELGTNIQNQDLDTPQIDISVVLSRIYTTIKAPLLHQVENTRPEFQELQKIVNPFVHSDNGVRRVYGEHLHHSLVALRKFEMEELRDTMSVDRTYLAGALSSCQDAVVSHFDMICRKLNQHPCFAWLSRGGLWPSLTPVTLLETLSSSSTVRPPGALKDNIIAYGDLITMWQRLLRIDAARKNFNDVQLRELSENAGHHGWSPKEHPEWLLLEIENNILIRTDQCIVAKAMITPGSGSNSILQMNMGQGKSSVIIPMIAAMLANKKQLLRIIVPKPLLLQMAQLLQARLGGLLGRAIKHVPFSRRSATSTDNVKAYLNLHQQSLETQGIILALPEHLLSFKLSGLQRLSSGEVQEAAFMMRVQSWLVTNSRDVLDECDYSLAVKTQLVYPSGAQRMVDGHPHRWKVIQSVLQLVKGTVEQLQLEFPRSIEITVRGTTGRFPAIHFSQDHVKNALIRRVTERVCSGEGGLLPINDCTCPELEAVITLLSKPRFTKEEVITVSELFRNRQSTRQDVLLLRGLLVYRILLMALSKRWNVQYGLHPKRDPVAVPYQAKGVPSDQAEFGHPDVAILLTCLSFYYSGLEEIQFEKVLKHVLKSDDPALEYDGWVKDAKMVPGSMRTWAAINADDEIQRKELWNHLRYNMVVINCFLNTFVFPHHAKTFERKLVSSAWDLPLPPSYQSVLPSYHGNPETRLNGDKQMVMSFPSVTTGFSGTNDNRTLLPLNIEQRDLGELAHINAEVLTYLLQTRNRNYVLAADYQGRRLSEFQFLCELCNRKIRMLLDAGAQILELDNHDLVKTWLIIDIEAEAAVFFDKEDKARVLYRDGRSQPLVGSHFQDNLGGCLVYLDEAHTRGTDLRMPPTSVAALTLGPGQTKDHTVQGKPSPSKLVISDTYLMHKICTSLLTELAAMRLRLLATKQVVVFFAPPEVHQSILNLRGKSVNEKVDSRDVISWLLEQSCRTIEQIQPLYISQGLDFCQRASSAVTNKSAATDASHRSRYLKVLEQPENYSLEQLYAPRKKIKAPTAVATEIPILSTYVDKLNYMRENLSETSETVQALAHQEVEQEREVAIEVETVREVKKPLQAHALRHLPLHEDVIQFVKRGRIFASTNAYEQAFLAMRRTGVGIQLGINGGTILNNLFATSDFMGTVHTDRGQPRDEYLRPVQWILWSTVSQAAMIISPHEAEALLDEIRYAKNPCTYLITYAAPVTRNMLPFDTLKFYSVPSLPPNWRAPHWLVTDLGIFAGRLYFDYTDYPHIRERLNLPAPKGAAVIENLCDELPFRDQSNDGPQNNSELFTKLPLEFMQQWLSVRRKGQDFSQTPMGQVCSGKEVKENSVLFAA